MPPLIATNILPLLVMISGVKVVKKAKAKAKAKERVKNLKRLKRLKKLKGLKRPKGAKDEGSKEKIHCAPASLRENYLEDSNLEIP